MGELHDEAAVGVVLLDLDGGGGGGRRGIREGIVVEDRHDGRD